jgi:hypothetical protein
MEKKNKRGGGSSQYNMFLEWTQKVKGRAKRKSHNQKRKTIQVVRSFAAVVAVVGEMVHRGVVYFNVCV